MEMSKNYIKTQIANTIKGLRKFHNISQQELASRTGISLGSISRIEREKDLISLVSLYKIAKAFDMKLSGFLAKAFL